MVKKRSPRLAAGTVRETPVSIRYITRGDVWLAALDPTLGSEIQKTHPCLIISPAEMHDYLRTVIVAPLTIGNHPAPFRVALNFAGKDGLILLDQIRALDKQRLIRRLGAVGHKTLSITLTKLTEVFAE